MVVGLVLLAPVSTATATWPGKNGLIVATRGRGSDLKIVSIDPSNGATRVLTRGHKDAFPSWSPDGTKIVFTRGPRDGNGIFVMDADGDNVRSVIGRTDREEVTPTWSPNGRWILFAMEDKGYTSVFKQRIDGTDRTKLVEQALHPSWSPTGKRIAYAKGVGPDYEIFTMRPNGSGKRRVTDNRLYDASPQWSPGGKMLLVTRFGARNFGDVWKIAADGSWEKRLTEARSFEGEAVWSPNGRLIAYNRSRADETGTDIWLMTSGGKFVSTLAGTDGRESSPDWQPRP